MHDLHQERDDKISAIWRNLLEITTPTENSFSKLEQSARRMRQQTQLRNEVLNSIPLKGSLKGASLAPVSGEFDLCSWRGAGE